MLNEHQSGHPFNHKDEEGQEFILAKSHIIEFQIIFKYYSTIDQCNIV